MEKKISYLNKTFADYKEALIEFSKKYYPDASVTYEDAGIASWLIDLNASVADNLAYHIDRVYQETNIDSAKERGSLYAIARNNGVKIPGPKGAMAEVKISFVLPVDDYRNGFRSTGPIVKQGTRFSSASQSFELQYDVDFSSVSDVNGIPDREIVPNRNTNNTITAYTVSKRAVVVAGETRVYRQYVKTKDIKPFMEIILPMESVMGVESIIVQDGEKTISPTYGTFFSSGCGKDVTRFYEVENLAQTEIWTEKTGDKGPETCTYGYDGTPTYFVTKGEWKPIDHKFITEYTDRGYLKIIFGAGVSESNVEIGDDASSFAKWQISRVLNNHNLGTLPNGDSTIFILYRVGGGAASNVAKGAISRVTYLNADFRSADAALTNSIMKSIRVENTTPSISGKDMPSENELKYYIKYHNAAQERCVTVKDYIDRILLLPPKYGTPFRVGVMEENNKVMVYLLGLNHEGKLDTALPITLVKNIENYLSGYRMINDLVEIKAGRIINLTFDADVIVDKNYNKGDVVSAIISTIENYMDINKRMMGEEIYVSDLEKEISRIDGVINLIGLRIYNKTDVANGYSASHIAQETMDYDTYSDGGYENIGSETEALIDLDATDGILYNEGDTMMEILNPDTDIRIKIKER